MIKLKTRFLLPVRIWSTTWLVFSAGAFIVAFFIDPSWSVIIFGGVAVASCLGSAPILLLLVLALPVINHRVKTATSKMTWLLLVQMIACLPYALLYSLVSGGTFLSTVFIQNFLLALSLLYSATAVATVFCRNRLMAYFASASVSRLSATYQSFKYLYFNKTNTHMENEQQTMQEHTPTLTSNKLVIKACITGGLILLMLIPTVFINNLVTERQQRQHEVVEEVSDKWAKAQTITGPYISIPYNETFTTKEGKQGVIKKMVALLPSDLSVSSKLLPQERKRSIYTVLLYQTDVTGNGAFTINVPEDVDAANLIFKEARLCMGVTDFKGIEEKVRVKVNGTSYDLTPGLPTTAIDKTGLSCSIPLTAADIDAPLKFSYNLKIRGSGHLSFVPLSGNTNFTIQSPWPNPSFSGTTLPTQRTVTGSGFEAAWHFHNANLPFNTFLKDFSLDTKNYAFGVSMVQPADQYSKTERSIKYAILFIGLTFSLFFIMEIMQNKPVHPVQYILIGIALVIFFSLLLAISEYVIFDMAYLIASSATVLLISLYAKSHFKKWKVVGIFGLITGLLYTFIFVLIRLEDTALLVGSIGLFVVLALVMYASRGINWYNPSVRQRVPVAE